MKKLLFILLISINSATIFSQNLDSTALLIIDIQEFYFPGGDMALSEPEMAAQNAAKLLEYFRKNDALVVHIRHNHEPGGAIHNLVEPLQNEKVISKNEVNSFLGTDLDNYLKKNNINNLILCGMQTHMCLEGATRAAHDLGYNCTVVHDACTTRDLTFQNITVKARDVHYSTLNTLKSYAKISTTHSYILAKTE